jgi:hypothetical protein
LFREGIDAAPLPQEQWQFHIKHLLVGTFLLAVALSPLHSILPPGGAARFHLDRELLVVLSAVILCNLLVTVPCIWGAFVSRADLVPLILGWIFYCAVLTLAEVVTLSVLINPLEPDAAYVGFLCYLVNIFQCVVVFGSLRLYRTLGLHLLRAVAASVGEENKSCVTNDESATDG